MLGRQMVCSSIFPGREVYDLKRVAARVCWMETRRAFTLVEALVSIAIIALLVGILAPALGRARDRSHEVASAVNLRSIGQIFEMYVAGAKGLYPAPVPGVAYPDPDPRLGSASMGHWQASTFWPNMFYKQYPWNENRQMFLAPGAVRDFEERVVAVTVIPASYSYSASFLGQPRVWSGEDIADVEWQRLERSVTRSMVRYPSGKALLWDVEMPYLRRPLERDSYQNLLESTPILFADQHIQSRVPAEANPGVTNWAPYASHAHPFLHNTRDGVYGRDY